MRREIKTPTITKSFSFFLQIITLENEEIILVTSEYLFLLRTQALKSKRKWKWKLFLLTSFNSLICPFLEDSFSKGKRNSYGFLFLFIYFICVCVFVCLLSFCEFVCFSVPPRLVENHIILFVSIGSAVD